MISLRSGAIFLADAHEGRGVGRGEAAGRPFWNFLQAVKEGRVRAPQLFLLGDIFDFLIGQIEAGQDLARPYFELMNELAEPAAGGRAQRGRGGSKMEIFYFEGNHDFNLAPLLKKWGLKNIKLIPKSSQPLLAKIQNSTLCLAHGDIFLPFLDGLFLGLLRLGWVLKILNFTDRILKNKLSARLRQRAKGLEKNIEDFEKLAQTRMKRYAALVQKEAGKEAKRETGPGKTAEETAKCWVVEGHFHQNFFRDFEEGAYFNLPVFAGQKSFLVVECGPDVNYRAVKLERGEDLG